MRTLAALLIAVLASQAYLPAAQSPKPTSATVGTFVHGLAPGTHVSLTLTNGKKVKDWTKVSELLGHLIEEGILECADQQVTSDPAAGRTRAQRREPDRSSR